MKVKPKKGNDPYTRVLLPTGQSPVATAAPYMSGLKDKIIQGKTNNVSSQLSIVLSQYFYKTDHYGSHFYGLQHTSTP